MKYNIGIDIGSTCANYYGLEGKQAVGTITNMYVIVEKLTSAAKVIRP